MKYNTANVIHTNCSFDEQSKYQHGYKLILCIFMGSQGTMTLYNCTAHSHFFNLLWRKNTTDLKQIYGWCKFTVVHGKKSREEIIWIICCILSMPLCAIMYSIHHLLLVLLEITWISISKMKKRKKIYNEQDGLIG